MRYPIEKREAVRNANPPMTIQKVAKFLNTTQELARSFLSCHKLPYTKVPRRSRSKYSTIKLNRVRRANPLMTIEQIATMFKCSQAVAYGITRRYKLPYQRLVVQATPEQLDLIRNSNPLMTAKQVADFLGCSQDSVYTILNRRNIPYKSKLIPNEVKDFIRNATPPMTIPEIRKHFGWSTNYAFSVVRTWELPYASSRKTTNENLDFIKRNFKKMRVSTQAAMLGVGTTTVVKARRKLKLQRLPKNRDIDAA